MRGAPLIQVRIYFLFAHDLIRKPVPTFRDHALDFLPGAGGCKTFAHGALLDVFDRVRHVDDAFDVNARRDDVVGIEIARLHQVLDLGDRHLAGGRHHRIEIARGLPIHEIAFGIPHPGVHDREIRDQTALHDVALAVELALFLALGDVGAGTGAGEEGGDAGAAGADALGQRALRIEFDLQLAGEILLGEQFVLAHVRRDHLLDLAGLQQQAETGAVHARIVRYDREVFDAGVADGEDQRFRDATEAEPAGHDQHAVFEQAGQRRACIGINFLHATIPLACTAAPLPECEKTSTPTLTVSHIAAPRRCCDWSIAAWTSRQASDERADQPSTHGCDGVWDVTLGP